MPFRRSSILLLLLLSGAAAGCVTPPETPPPEPPASRGLACVAHCGVTVETGRLWEPMIAVDPTDPAHLVASSQVKGFDPATGGTSWALSHVSRDGGATWETHRLPGGRDAPPDHPLARTVWMDDSVPMFLPDGTLLWTVLAMDGASQPGVAVWERPDLVALRSHDGGVTFPDVVVVAEAVGPRTQVGGVFDADFRDGHDKQWTALGPDGTLLLVWSQNTNGRPDECGTFGECTRLRFSTSTDGLAWSEPGTVVEHMVSGAFPLVLADGTWLVSYHHTAEQEVVVARSTDRGATWTSEVLDASTKFPMMAQSRTADGERVHLVYPRGEDGRDGEQTVVLRSSDDGGITWSPGLVVDEPLAPGRTIPAVAGAPGGGAYVTYWSPSGESAEYRAVLVQEGEAWAPVVLDVHRGATSETGDYMGIASLPDGGAVTAWTAAEGDAMRVAGAVLGGPGTGGDVATRT